MKRTVILANESHSVELMRRGENATVRIAGRTHECSLRCVCAAEYRLILGGQSYPLWVAEDRDVIHVHVLGRAWQMCVSNPTEIGGRAAQVSANAATAPMPGTVVNILVAAGEPVVKGQPMVIIESMKMESEVSAHRAGTVEAVLLSIGESFERGASLVTLTAEGLTQCGG